MWTESESPDQDLTILVATWMLSRFDDPYQGVRREPGFDTLWWGQVPLSLRDGAVVVCSYLVEESTRTVTCKSIASLNLPL